MTTAQTLKLALGTMRAHDTLDSLIDASPAVAARRIAAADADTCRVLLLGAVTGVHRRYRVPQALPAEPRARELENTERVRRVVRDVLDAYPEAIPPLLLALADATRPTTESETP